MRRVSFPQFDAPLRTDTGFRKREYAFHHNENSPLENITYPDGSPLLNMVKDFPTSDPLHHQDQGVMKRLLTIWCNGSTVYKNKWKKSDLNLINQAIYDCNKDLSSDVNRQLRSLNFMKFFKATEFRTILLYAGMVIFQDRLSDEIYEHFLSFCLAIRLYSCETYVKKQNLRKLARSLLADYCVNFVKFYGSNAIVSNIHNISHIADDVERFGALSNISTYPFENLLREIKYRTQASNNPLEQITRRIAELTLDVKKSSINFDSVEMNEHLWKPELMLKYESGFEKIRITPNVILSTRKKGDCWFITHQNEIVKMNFAVKRMNSFFICGSEIRMKSDFFTLPYPSHLSDIYMSDGELQENRMFDISNIKAKMMCLSRGEKIVLIPILHSLDECVKFNLVQN